MQTTKRYSFNLEEDASPSKIVQIQLLMIEMISRSLSDLEIACCTLNWKKAAVRWFNNPAHGNYMGGFTYQQCVEYLELNEERQRFIKEKVLKAKIQIDILSEQKRLCEKKRGPKPKLVLVGGKRPYRKKQKDIGLELTQDIRMVQLHSSQKMVM